MKKLLAKDGNLPLVFRPVHNFDEERRYSVTIIPRAIKPEIIEEGRLESLGNSEQDFQVKIEVAGKAKMYATGTAFAKGLSGSDDGGTAIEYASASKAMEDQEPSPSVTSPNEWRRKSNRMKRLSLDLPEAIEQVNEEIKEVGEDIDSFIDSIKSYRNSL